MSATLQPPAEAERITWLERPDDDFPYYRGQPVEITPVRWWVVMAAVAAGFAILIWPLASLRGPAGAFVPAILYVAIPLAALAWAAGRGWTALFRPIRAKDLLIIVGFAVLNLIVSVAMGPLIMRLTETTGNQVFGGLSALEGGALWLFFARTALQLFGEELMSILPFLALMYWLAGRRGMARKSAIVVSVLIVALLFAAEHLPTYNFNVVQSVLGVGVARIVLIIPYIITKNIWVAAGTHILYDWSNFALVLVFAGGPAVDG